MKQVAKRQSAEQELCHPCAISDTCVFDQRFVSSFGTSCFLFKYSTRSGMPEATPHDGDKEPFRERARRRCISADAFERVDICQAMHHITLFPKAMLLREMNTVRWRLLSSATSCLDLQSLAPKDIGINAATSTVIPSIADRSEGFPHRAAPPQRREDEFFFFTFFQNLFFHLFFSFFV